MKKSKLVSCISLFLLPLLYNTVFCVPDDHPPKSDDNIPVHQDPRIQHNNNVKPPSVIDNSNENPDHVPHPKMRAPRKKHAKEKPVTLLVDNPDCSEDITRLCAENLRSHNFAVLNCLQESEEIARKVSTKCHHVIYKFKRNLTESNFFHKMTQHTCEEDIKQCAHEEPKYQVSCLVEQKNKVKDDSCRSFLNRIGVLVFSDYRLMHKFVDACSPTIERLKCGRVGPDRTADSKEEDEEDDDDDQPGSQGYTIDCLMERVGQIDDAPCQLQLLRVAELQSDDFHLDRPFFYACRDDREHLCPSVPAGEGKVYKCLVQHKFDERMSDACKKQITKRQSLAQKDYRVDYSMFRACGALAKNVSCDLFADSVKKEHGQHTGESAMVLCLENFMKEKKGFVTPECKEELLVWRGSLMEDYKMSPELVMRCKAPITKYCNGVQRNGLTLHCLMDEVRKTPPQTVNGKLVEREDMPAACVVELEKLVQEADVTTDVRVDPVVKHACQPELDNQCSQQRVGSSKDIYGCLLRLVENEDEFTSANCIEKMTELAYIVVQNYKFDDKIYSACHKDAMQSCDADKLWADTSKTPTVSREHAVFHCLHNIMRNDPSKLESACATEVHRTVRERSGNVELNPEIYYPCFPDLVKHCSEPVDKDSKMRCLQKKIDHLTPDCTKAIMDFTSDEQADLSLDMKAYALCKPSLHLLCKDELEESKQSADAHPKIMECLIRHKAHPDMEERCAAIIEIAQIVSLKNFHISPQFRHACSDNVKEYCPEKQTIPEVVKCLSEVATHQVVDAIDDGNGNIMSNPKSKMQLTAACLKQLDFQLLQRSENIKLDPKLHDDCLDDAKKFCSKVKPGGGKMIMCLQRHQDDLSPQCHDRLFKRELQQATNQRLDEPLMMACEGMIKKHCADIPHPRKGLIGCLARALTHHEDDEFDAKCRTILLQRMRVRNRDYRLHPLLASECKVDIKQRCTTTLGQHEGTNKEFNGRVLACLKKEYVDSRKTGKALSVKCEDHVRSLIINSNLFHHVDPILVRACNDTIRTLCGQEAEDTDAEIGDGHVTNCLKKKFADNKVTELACQKEVLRLISEAKADIHVDPILYKACSNELRTICGKVALGAGRQMSCLLWAKDDKEASKAIGPTCRMQLADRVEMWEMAAKLAPPETFGELKQQILESSSRNYFLVVLAILILGIFIFGLCFGRVTKRLYVEEKNK